MRRYWIEFFGAAEADPSGFGEGEVLLGDAVGQTDPTGLLSFDLTYPSSDPPPQFVTARVTQLGSQEIPLRSSEMSAVVPTHYDQGDEDGDGVLNGADCAPTDPELQAAVLTSTSGLYLDKQGDMASLAWTPPADAGAAVNRLRYWVFRADRPDGFAARGDYTTLPKLPADTQTSDPEIPAPGELFFYTVATDNDCGAGPIGFDGSGTPRALDLAVTSYLDDGPGSLRDAIRTAIPGEVIPLRLAGRIELETSITFDTPLAILGPGASTLRVQVGSFFNTAPFRYFNGIGTTTIKDLDLLADYGFWVLGEGAHAVIERCRASRGIVVDPGSTALIRDTLVVRYLYVEDASARCERCTLTDSVLGAWVVDGGSLELESSTIADASQAFTIEEGSTLYLRNTLLSSTNNCSGTPISLGYNASDMDCSLSGPGDLSNVSITLSPLQDNGGPVPTYLPTFDSPTIDAGECPGQPLDARGLPRPVDDPAQPNASDGCDIGAVERQASDL